MRRESLPAEIIDTKMVTQLHSRLHQTGNWRGLTVKQVGS